LALILAPKNTVVASSAFRLKNGAPQQGSSRVFHLEFCRDYSVTET